MSGSAIPPPPGTPSIDRPPVYGFQSGPQPAVDFTPVHDRETTHYDVELASQVVISEIDPGPLPAGTTLFDTLVALEALVTAQEG